jgi:hypothetical protein
MDNTQIDDLKQFIQATVSQATSDMVTKDDISTMATKDDITLLGNKINDLELKVDTISETLNYQYNQQENRITKLEQGALS